MPQSRDASVPISRLRELAESCDCTSCAARRPEICRLAAERRKA